MSKMKVEKPSQEQLEALNVEVWPIWKKEVSSFNWSYGEKETCYILEGTSEVKAEDGEVIKFEEGDLVTFFPGLNCVWDIKGDIKKHYKMG